MTVPCPVWVLASFLILTIIEICLSVSYMLKKNLSIDFYPNYLYIKHLVAIASIH